MVKRATSVTTVISSWKRFKTLIWQHRHGGSLATVARPRREHGELNVPTYGHDYKHGELYIPTFESIVSATLEAWWQRVPLSAGRIELRPASLSFIHVESEFLPFNDYNLTFLYVNRVFCTIRFPDGGG